MNIRDILTRLVSGAFAQCGYDPSLGGVTESARPDFCQYQCNGALPAAKQAKKPPMQIAADIIADISAGFSQPGSSLTHRGKQGTILDKKRNKPDKEA